MYPELTSSTHEKMGHEPIRVGTGTSVKMGNMGTTRSTPGRPDNNNYRASWIRDDPGRSVKMVKTVVKVFR